MASPLPKNVTALQWISIATSGVVAALVTLGANWWLLRPRAQLRFSASSHTLEDQERMQRAAKNSSPEEQARALAHVFRLTNFGDGTAFDIVLRGTNCRARVWVR